MAVQYKWGGHHAYPAGLITPVTTDLQTGLSLIVIARILSLVVLKKVRYNVRIGRRYYADHERNHVS